LTGGVELDVGPVMKQAIGQGSADALVEEDEQGAHTGSLFGEAVGVVLAHALQQAVAFHFAQVVTELIEGVGLRKKGKSSPQGFPDLDGTPAVHLRPTVEQHFQEAHHAGVVNLDARDFALSPSDGKSQTLKQGKVDMDIEQFPFDAS